MTEQKRKGKAEKPKSTLLSAGEVARIFNLHVSTIRRWSRQGIIKSYPVGPGGGRGCGRGGRASFPLAGLNKKYQKNKPP